MADAVMGTGTGTTGGTMVFAAIPEPDGFDEESARLVCAAFEDLREELPEFGRTFGLVRPVAIDLTAPSPYESLVGDVDASDRIAQIEPSGRMSINPDVFSGMLPPERAAVVMHELMHLLNMEILGRYARGLRGFQTAFGWNMCADASINAAIRDLAARGITATVTLPEGCIYPEALDELEHYDGAPSVPAWATAGGYYDFLRARIVHKGLGRIPELDPIEPSPELAERFEKVAMVARDVKSAILANPRYRGSYLADWSRSD
ncbi:DUF2201 family putative metallopeptidase [Demequina iriomotensis]|uniref:DUF2201 family putative metallopeptidase n=1 Tax=Demequina iriomotensis TaxID=1536641 RepID=UPI0007867C6B|nr:hypothetical protein [Demequina iriomotensis]